MADKFTRRYKTFQTSLARLEKSRHANVEDDFVLEGTVQNFNLTFDLAWKVMKDIIVQKFAIVDFAVGSPREVLRRAFVVGLISDDAWMDMLDARNQLAHDYDGSMAEREFSHITHEFYDLMAAFADKAESYAEDG